MKGRRTMKMRWNSVQTIRNSTKDREGISTRDRGGEGIGTKRDSREGERENDDIKWYIILREDTRIARRLKTGIEPNWFRIMPCASIYSDVRSTPEVSRMFKGNLEYTWISYSEIINENNIFCIV